MVGLGCGARSYTRTLHYSDRYGVERASVTSILQQYVNTPASSFAQAHYGFVLDAFEQRRRYLIQSLLVLPGLDEAAYRARFGTPPLEDFPQLTQLLAARLAHWHNGYFALTAEGLAHADTIGPWLNSADVVARMESYATG
jgi:oxygen-independent coproporphyrinogen-3 oxidase